ncbi:MAG: type II toxin-antitoxin system RelE/ParE family toxin [Pseudomonadota bacterium]
MHVRLTADAKADLDNIRDYLEPRSRQGLDRIISAVFTTLQHLETFPLMGKPGRIEGTYELIIPGTSLFLIYSMADATRLDVDRIWDARMQYPPED